ncbi:MAG: DUF938 domain-containing protein [Synechococcus sp.]
MTDAFPSEPDRRLFFPATQRNQAPIAEVLERWLPSKGHLLEIASGSGEHAVAFQRRFPELVWQASDPDPDHCASVAAWMACLGLTGAMPAPLQLDVRRRPWPLPQAIAGPLDAVLAINLIHIAPWACCEALVGEAAERLGSGGSLILYGPFRRNGRHTSASNEAFDASLRARCASWGVRDLEAVQTLASTSGLTRCRWEAMPANNLMVAFSR